MDEHRQADHNMHDDAAATRRTIPTIMALLTPRQCEIARLIAGGHTNADIGAALGLDRLAVTDEVESLYDELGLDSRVRLAVWALEQVPVSGARHGGAASTEGSGR